MEVSYRKDTYHTYMVIEGNDAKTAGFEEKILVNQQANVFLPFQIQYLDGKKEYCYDTTGMVDLVTYVGKKQLDAGELDLILHFLIAVYQTVDEYLLDLNEILLEIPYLYVNMGMQSIGTAYVPGTVGDFMERLQRFTGYLLENTNHNDQDAVLKVYDLYRIVRQENFVPGHLEDLCNHRVENKLQNENPPQEDNRAFEMKADILDEPDKTQQSDIKQKNNLWKVVIPAGCGIAIAGIIGLLNYCGYLELLLERAGLEKYADQIGFVMVAAVLLGIVICSVVLFVRPLVKQDKEADDQDVWADYEKDYTFSDMSYNIENQTMVLMDKTSEIRMISLDKNTSGDLMITKIPCIFGSRRSESDIVISSGAVSRKHAKLVRTEEGICLSDLSSTNGTYVNGEKLKEKEERYLMPEDIITFADVRFIYCGNHMPL